MNKMRKISDWLCVQHKFRRILALETNKVKKSSDWHMLMAMDAALQYVFWLRHMNDNHHNPNDVLKRVKKWVKYAKIYSGKRN